MNIEDVFTDFLYRAVKDRFLEMVKERDCEIRALCHELLTKEVISDHIKDIVAYDDEIRDLIMGFAFEEIKKKLKIMED